MLQSEIMWYTHIYCYITNGIITQLNLNVNRWVKIFIETKSVPAKTSFMTVITSDHHDAVDPGS